MMQPLKAGGTGIEITTPKGEYGLYTYSGKTVSYGSKSAYKSKDN